VLIYRNTFTPFSKRTCCLCYAEVWGYNNSHPREQQSKLTGFGARALTAHQNAFESLIIFAPAVL